MALRLAGEQYLVQEVMQQISYSPGLQDSGDLETSTKTITATSKQATADYTTNLTIASPPSKLSVLRLGLRLQMTIDSFNAGATTLNYGVEVNGTQRLTGNWTATGAQYAVVDLTSGQFNLGSANEIKVYLWVDQGNAVVSVAEVWLGVGSTQTSGGAIREYLEVAHTGMVQISYWQSRIGSGTDQLRFYTPSGAGAARRHLIWSTGDAAGHDMTNNTSTPRVMLVANTLSLAASSQGVATDLIYLSEVGITFRSIG